MKYSQLSLLLLSSLILGGTNVFAAEHQYNNPGSEVSATERPLTLAAADIELDVTMEVIDEDITSSEQVMNVIELPVPELRREKNRQQTEGEPAGNGVQTQTGGGEPARIIVEQQTGPGGPDQHQGTPPVIDRPGQGLQPVGERPDVTPSSSGISDRQVERPEITSPSSDMADQQQGVKETARDSKNNVPLQKGK
ncbi:MAG: hypothetical protein V1706_10280 [Pseudomonadota bacterium]